jgi:hypothetical protein
MDTNTPSAEDSSSNPVSVEWNYAARMNIMEINIKVKIKIIAQHRLY